MPLGATLGLSTAFSKKIFEKDYPFERIHEQNRELSNSLQFHSARRLCMHLFGSLGTWSIRRYFSTMPCPLIFFIFKHISAPLEKYPEANLTKKKTNSKEFQTDKLRSIGCSSCLVYADFFFYKGS